MPSAYELFEAKLERRGDHVVWTGSRDHRGVGMVRVDNKLRTVQRAAWEFAHGTLAPGLRVRTCAGERACVRIDHLSISPTAGPTTKGRRGRGTGSIQHTASGAWKITVSDGKTPTGRQRRRTTTAYGDRHDAERALADLLHAVNRTDLGDLRIRELVGRYLEHTYHDATSTDVGAARDRDLLHHILEPALGDHLAAITPPLEIERALEHAAATGTPLPDARDALRLLRRTYQWAITRRWHHHDPTENINTRWLGR